MITVQLEPKDLIEAYKLHRRWGLWMWSVNCLTSAVYFGLASWLIFWIPGMVSFGAGLIAFVFLFWIFLAYVKFILPSQIARHRFKRQKRLQRSRTLSWDDSAFSSVAETGVSHTPWSDFLKWRENEYLFLLYMGRALFTIVPKRAFDNPRDIVDFGRVLRQHIGNEGKWRRDTDEEQHAGVANPR